ncbi:MAG: hypothetical protein H6624_08005 [Bdellovibrionaceae bacterium]|nr:hypothetical protein [Bdellovibrionales bacterium]MCB9084275.1 hypothetical protein [Pseudobdellovibrionaceae bacterium]
MALKYLRLIAIIFVCISLLFSESDALGEEGDLLSLRQDWERAQRLSISKNQEQVLITAGRLLRFGFHDSVIQDQVANFLRRQFIRGRGRLPTEWNVPQVIDELQFQIRTTQGSMGNHFSVHLQGQTHGTKVKGAQVWLLQGQDKRAVLDSLGGDALQVSTSQQPDSFRFHVATGGNQIQVVPGLYHLQVFMENGQRVEGAFVVSQEMALPEPPQLEAEVSSADDCRIRFKWGEPSTESFRSFEERDMSVVVFGKGGSLHWQLRPSAKVEEMKRVQWPEDKSRGIYVEDPGQAQPQHFQVMYSGIRYFGPLQVSREAARTVEFPKCPR